jgi:hypothetical protein
MNIELNYAGRMLRDEGFAARFWYWRGASGREYIHSVFGPEACPPLPGAVYVAVRRRGERRQALAVGMFSEFWNADDGFHLAHVGADEIHVHLLARDAPAARQAAADLVAAIASDAARHAPAVTASPSRSASHSRA